MIYERILLIFHIFSAYLVRLLSDPLLGLPKPLGFATLKLYYIDTYVHICTSNYILHIRIYMYTVINHVDT